MKIWRLAIVLALGTAGAVGCADECPTGDGCSKTCDPGFTGICVAEGLCECTPVGMLPDGGAGGFGGGAGGVGGGGAGGGDGCRAPQPGDLVVNEIMPNPMGADGEAEYVELVNTTAEPVSLRSLSFFSNKTSGEEETAGRIIVGCLAGNGAVAMFKSPANWIWSPEPVGAWEADMGSFNLVNSSNAGDPYFIVRDANSVVIDRANYALAAFGDGVSANRDPDVEGVAFAKHTDVFPGRSESPGFCASGATFAEGCGAPPVPDMGVDPDDGVPPPDAGVDPDMAPDPDDGVLPPDAGVDPDMALQPDVPALPTPGFSEVIVSEIMYDTENPLSDSDAEWIELHSLADGPRTLTGCELRDASANGRSELSGTIEAGAYVVIAASDLPEENGGLTPLGTFGFGLNNGEDTITLSCDGVEIDVVAYRSSGDWPAEAAASIQLTSSRLDALSNDDPLNWCLSADVYFADEVNPHFGSPGAPNVECPLQ